MSQRKWKTVRRYRDGLTEPSFRGVVTDRGIEWVCDRFHLVRTDMFSLRVTNRGGATRILTPGTVRKILDERPVVGRAIYAKTAHVLGLVGDDEMSALLVSSGLSASLFSPQAEPLIDACDLLRLKDGRLYGYQHRPCSHAPVLVAVLAPTRWSRHFFRCEVAS